MIKQTFYNLPQSKRERIIMAIRMEFGRCPASKISINRIVHTAKISRGSFYQYFDDKVDLVEIITEGFMQFSIKVLIDSLEKNDGDIFQANIDLFDATVEFSQMEHHKGFFKNVVNNIKVNNDLFTDYMKNRYTKKEGDRFINYINTSKFRFNNEDENRCITEILYSFLFVAMFRYFARDEDLQMVRENLIKKIQILKIGAIDPGKENCR